MILLRAWVKTLETRDQDIIRFCFALGHLLNVDCFFLHSFGFFVNFHQISSIFVNFC